MATLEVSRATLNRDLSYLRDRLNAPIVHDRELGGYRLSAETGGAVTQYEMPGLWFSAEEIHALLTMQHLLANLDTGGLIGPYIQPLLGRLNTLIGAANNPADQVARRVRIQTVGARRFRLDQFQVLGSALLSRKRLIIDYHARGSNKYSRREVSPQRLVHYRDNWYLDGWCHMRDELRSFAVDAIKTVKTIDDDAHEIPEAELDAVLGAGYGIFSGAHVQWATLSFSSDRARWVAAEHWHPEQEGVLLDDGSYQLRLPFSNDPELIMDILKYGPECEVVGPEGLRDKVVGLLKAAAGKYRDE
jgi:predicted DNA-binding transcriptional regulator YafY